jgi:hypothetical protein
MISHFGLWNHFMRQALNRNSLTVLMPALSITIVSSFSFSAKSNISAAPFASRLFPFTTFIPESLAWD